MFAEDFMRSEVDRYLGLPGPGDLLQGRRAGVARVPRRGAKARTGAAFDLKEFHRYALDLGCMGLDQFRAEMARY